MAKPAVHARSSAKRFGGTADQYTAVHELMDLSKSAHATVRHRAVFHHRLGAVLIGRIKPSVWLDAGHAVPVERIVEQHAVEDLGFYPGLGDYVRELDRDAIARVRWMNRRPWGVEDHCIDSTKRWGGSEEDYAAVHMFLDLDLPGWDEPVDAADARIVLHHAFGCFVAEMAFGAAFRNSAGREVHVRDVAERHVLSDLGRIPDLGEWCAVLKLKPWMAGARKVTNDCND